MDYKFIADKIEVRSITTGDKPRYIVKGTAMMANKPDIYQYMKNPDGTYRTLKSIFTSHCIESIQNQAKHKSVFVDSKHELALNTNIKSMVKGKISADEEKKLDSMLKTKMMPLAKINDIDIVGDALNIATEMNPMFRELDLDHQKYFDAVWYNLDNHYLNGISANFANPTIIKDENDQIVIDDVDILGFSYESDPALHDNSIYEVAIRAMQNGIEIRTGENNMTEENDKLKAEQAKLDEERKSFEKQKSDYATKQAEDVKATEIANQKAQQEQINADLASKTEALKKAEEDKTKLTEELNRAKGVVNPNQTPPASNNNQNNNVNYDSKFYKENIDNITEKSKHFFELKKQGKIPMADDSMTGFVELVNLQAKIDPTAGLDTEQAHQIKTGRLLDRGKADIITPKLKAD